MNDSVRYAAERLRRFVDSISDEDNPSPELTRAIRTLLAEYPEDSDTPVDEAWLRSVGFEQYLDCFRLRNRAEGYELARSSEGLWDYMGRYIKAPTTRCDVRRLAAVLGLTLKQED